MAYIKDSPNTLTAGEWLADLLEPDMMYPAGGKIDASQFVAEDAVVIAVSTSALQNATSFTVTALVDPLPLPIATYTPPARVLVPSGSIFYFGGQKIAVTTQDAVAGDTTIHCAALPTAFAGGETYTWPGAGKFPKAIVSGTLVGRTFAERAANTPFGAAALTDDEIMLVAFDKQDLSKDSTVDLVRATRGVSIYEDRLPQYSSLINVAHDEVQTVTIAGSLSAGVILVGDGKGKTVSMAFNANLAAIQAAYDTLYGSGATVIAGTVASYTITFSGTGFTGVSQTLSTVDASGATGNTTATVVRTTTGGKPWLDKIRSLWTSGVSYN